MYPLPLHASLQGAGYSAIYALESEQAPMPAFTSNN
jgi:hypothetical protein